MKRVLSMAILPLLVLLLATSVIAETNSPAPAARKATKSFVGVVVNVNTSAMTLALKGKKGEEAFDVASAQYATGTRLEEIKAGDNIGVEYLVKDGKNVATLVAKVRPKGEKGQKREPRQ
jgi:hypothetical protein